MKNIRFCYLKILCFLEVKFYIYLNRCVLVMKYRTLSFLKTATATIERVKNAGPGSDYIPLNCTKSSSLLVAVVSERGFLSCYIPLGTTWAFPHREVSSEIIVYGRKKAFYYYTQHHLDIIEIILP